MGLKKGRTEAATSVLLGFGGFLGFGDRSRRVGGGGLYKGPRLPLNGSRRVLSQRFWVGFRVFVFPPQALGWAWGSRPCWALGVVGKSGLLETSAVVTGSLGFRVLFSV